MKSFEQLVRYTTWFGAFSDAIIPLYLFFVFATFGLWLILSYALRRAENARILGATTYTDHQGYVAPRSAWPTVLLAPAAASSTILPMRVSTIASSTSNAKLWLLRALTALVSGVFFVLHREVVPRVRWLMLPALYTTVALHGFQWLQSAGSSTLCTRAWISAAVHRFRQLCDHLPPSARRLLQFRPAPRAAYYMQGIVAVLACAFAVYVFATNEPLTRPVPSFGLPRKMCPSGPPPLPITSVLRDYSQFHAEMLQRPLDQQRLLVYHTTNEGLGNRIEGLVSAFVLAVLTDRAFVVHWRAQSKCNAELRDLFAKPGFEWETKHWMTSQSAQQHFYYAYCRACPIRTRQDALTETWESLLCKPNAGFDPDVKIVSVRSTQWFAPVLAMNPHLKEKLCRLFGADIYGAVAPHLLQLNDQLKSRFDAFKQEHAWNKDSEVISLQIRRLEGFGIGESIANAFLRCAATITEDTDKAKYFLATDHIPTRDKFKEYLGDRLIHLDSKFDRETKRGIQDAVLDMYLLGEAKNMIMSPYSTFGDISHARTSLVPYKVGRNGQCTKQLTSHPCFFYYFGMFDLSCFNSDMVLAELTNQEECYN